MWGFSLGTVHVKCRRNPSEQTFAIKLHECGGRTYGCTFFGGGEGGVEMLKE